MKTRDRVISFVIVGAVIGGIWWAGAKLRGPDVVDAARDAPITSATPDSSASNATASEASTANLAVDAAVDALAVSGTCRALNDATMKKLDDAKKARPCIPAFDTSMLSCRTSSNGATWGLRVDDVVEIGATDECSAGWLVRLVHIDVNGAEAAIVPGISATQRAHTYDVAADTRIADVTFFDWDADGEDEVFVRATRSSGDVLLEQRATVWTFRASDARIVPYEAASGLTIVGVRDVDGDGRPDLLVTFFGAGHNAPPTTHTFMAHSLEGGTFSLRDAAAATFAEKACPRDPKLDLASKSPDDFDADLADAIACALVWGHEPKELTAALAKACPMAHAVEAGTCPAWALHMVQTKPPLSLR